MPGTPAGFVSGAAQPGLQAGCRVSPATISAIAIVATLNTILAQMTMAARVIYGMARQGDLPAIAGHVHPRTATPILPQCSLWRW